MNLIVDVSSVFYKYKKKVNDTIDIDGDKIHNKAIQIFEKKLMSLKSKHNITSISLCFETEGILKKTIKFCSEYKKHRIKDNHKMDYSFLWIKKLFTNYDDVEILSQKGYEGDEIVFHKKISNKDKKLIWSDDSDLLQLIDTNTSVLYEDKIISINNILTEIHLDPLSIVFFKSLFGDKADGIKPSVSGRYSEDCKIKIATGDKKLDIKKLNLERFKTNLYLVGIGSLVSPEVNIIKGKFNKSKLDKIKDTLHFDNVEEFEL